jgi:phosphatidylserine decarboxylase
MKRRLKKIKNRLRLHREGRNTLLIVLGGLLLLNVLFLFFLPALVPYSAAASLLVLIFFLQFFRHPGRLLTFRDNSMVYAPADGEVVAIEEVFEEEYFKEKRIQISIFMSPFNVHVNRNPIGGEVRYTAYHPGRYLVAWHPKSSAENERTTVVLESTFGAVLIRQIAGAVARRIVLYLKEGQTVEQGEELGFIKFGSRVDVLLPLDIDILVKTGQRVKANKDRLAAW